MKSLDPSSERLSVTIVVAVLVHIVVIYAVSFSLPKPTQPNKTKMEIILVQKNTHRVPKKADYLAPFNNEGNGENKRETSLSTPMNTPFLEQMVSARLPTLPLRRTPHQNQFKPLVTEKPAKYSVKQQKIIQKNSHTHYDENAISENTLFINKVSAKKLANIQAKLDEKFNLYAKRLRRKHINASTLENKYANYMERWRRQIEYIGNLNYPDKARYQQLSGHLILEVVLNANGTIRHVEIKQASRYKILDEAALRIVHLAAPFAPFPKNIRKEIDVLHITRTWEFRYNSLMSR